MTQTTMPPARKIDLNSAGLRRHGLFAGVTEQELQELMALFRVGHWPRGERIVAEGDCGSTLYVVHQGGVDVLKQIVSRQGSRTAKITSLSEGDTFGEMALLDQEPYTASVVTNADSIVLALDNTDVRKLNPRIYATMLANLAREVSRRLNATDSYFATSLFSNH